ncbi:O-antigen ligase family protein [Candidatus Peregrinibacteria bacterium]|nr:MAG: O-antigen ligase family protein [Candidatus Peregrinibacteria bacterium]
MGEVWRALLGFPLLLTDLIIGPFLLLWGVDKLVNDRIIRMGRVGRMIALFLFLLVLTYLLNAFRFSFTEIRPALPYLIRFGAYVSMAFVTFDLIERYPQKPLRLTLVVMMVLSALVIALFGFLQLRFFPSFLELGLHLEGWDPHIGRLLSTWFDPNFVGGLFAFVSPMAIAVGIYYHRERKWMHFLIAGLVSILLMSALYYTFSRSSYLALVVALGVLSFLKSRTLLVAGFILVLIAFSVSGRVQERVLSGVDSAIAIFSSESQKPVDPTAQLRLDSWSHGMEIALDYPLIGAGYGRYPFEMQSRGYGNLTDHAIGGSDSSLLTIWANAGVFSLLAYLAVGFVAATLSIRRIFLHPKTLRSYLDAGVVAGFAGMMLHSQFVNSLLFALIMVYLYVAIALLDEVKINS